MRNDGKCPDCDVLLILDNIREGEIQDYICPKCHQILFRKIDSLEIFKTIREAENVAA